MELILVISLLVGFFLTLFFTPIWIRRAKDVGLVGKDIHKNEKVKVSEAGGVCVLFGFVLGILSYIALKTFYFHDMNQFVEMFALLSVVMIVSFIGIIDDILGWKIGLTKRTRILFLIFASIPLVVINAGESIIFGVKIGLLYPLVFIPIGIVGATATFNFLAGYNGLEASQGIIILTSLAIIARIMENNWLAFIAFIMVSCLFAFLIFNKTPAKIFPGDVLTYSIGALIATIAILGNIEKIAIFFFIPYIIETGLKLRGKLEKQSFAKLNSDGSLEVPYKKFYGLEHIAVYLLKRFKKSHKAYEAEVVYLINSFQVMIIILGLVIFRGTIF
ncbi:MAG: glycosyl transferase family 4 [Candidatus Pacearchaeota archaeon]|jgi:UDP-N-acetylglucosamine--dolichyl-phosphate N-acetylglucosaminephosphotransferase